VAEDILEDIDLDELAEVEDEHELFEHFRFVVDKGTNTIRVDK